MNQVLLDLRNALEPRQPYYALGFYSNTDVAEVNVYSADTHEITFAAGVTESVARTMIDGASQITLDGDSVEFEEIIAHFDAKSTALTCTQADIADFVRTAVVNNGACMVTVDGAHWEVK